MAVALLLSDETELIRAAVQRSVNVQAANRGF
jgi:hypothetical protein